MLHHWGPHPKKAKQAGVSEDRAFCEVSPWVPVGKGGKMQGIHLRNRVESEALYSWIFTQVIFNK
jgi:hypothetical protein